MSEMIHFLTGYGPFAAKLAQINLKEATNACIAESRQQSIFGNHAQRVNFNIYAIRTEFDKDIIG
jgi:hypothetical protein